MAHVEARKTLKDRNFSAEEERSSCKSFLADLYNPIGGKGQCNSKFWIVSFLILMRANHA